MIETNTTALQPSTKTTPKTRTSRRILARRRKKLSTKFEPIGESQLVTTKALLPSISNSISSVMQTFTDRIKNYCLGHFGFVPNKQKKA